MKVINFLFAMVISINLAAQVDSIERGLWNNTHDLIIRNNQYYALSNSKSIMDSDSLIFLSSKYFDNFRDCHYQVTHFDSIQFVIASRTLRKSYNESILFDKKFSFIRICWLREKSPIIIRLNNLDSDSLCLSRRIGNGKYERHGKVVSSRTVLLSKHEIAKVSRCLKNLDLFNMVNAVDCPTDMLTPNVFFVEICNSAKYNVFVISECNLDQLKYKDIYRLFEILDLL